MDAEKSQRSSITEERRPQAKQHDSSNFTQSDWDLDKSALRRLDVTVLPLCAITYFLNFLARYFSPPLHSSLSWG